MVALSHLFTPHLNQPVFRHGSGPALMPELAPGGASVHADAHLDIGRRLAQDLEDARHKYDTAMKRSDALMRNVVRLALLGRRIAAAANR